MAFVTTRGARFHTVELGRNGPPVVMLHGLFTGSLASWYFTAAPALAAAHRVRLIDWRGHGLSDRTPAGYTSAEMAADLADLTADLPEFAVVGHSFGALVAARYALAHPGRVTRLALVDPPLTTGPLSLDRLRDLVGAEFEFTRSDRSATGPPDLPDDLDPALLDSLLADRTTGLAHVNPPPDTGPLPRDRPHDLGPAPLDSLLAETTVLADLAAEPPLTDEDLAALPDLPLLAVAGSESPFRDSLERLGRVRPSARCQVLPGGHDLHVTAKDALATLLTEFLDG